MEGECSIKNVILQAKYSINNVNIQTIYFAISRASCFYAH